MKRLSTTVAMVLALGSCTGDPTVGPAPETSCAPLHATYVDHRPSDSLSNEDDRIDRTYLRDARIAQKALDEATELGCEWVGVRGPG